MKSGGVFHFVSGHNIQTEQQHGAENLKRHLRRFIISKNRNHYTIF